MKPSLIQQRRNPAAPARKPAVSIDPMARADAAIAAYKVLINATRPSLSAEPATKDSPAVATRAAYQKKLDASSTRVLKILTNKKV